MEQLELALLILTYTVLIITLFLEVICYQRKLETPQTIAFTASILLLVVAITTSYFTGQVSDPAQESDTFLSIAVTLLGLTTFLNVLTERKHNIGPIWKKLAYLLSGAILLGYGFNYFIDISAYLKIAATAFLGLSVGVSMVLIRMTKPQKSIAHREKIERQFALAFLVFIPLSLLGNYLLEMYEIEIRIGFTIPVIFILLALSKLLDDLKRLSLFKAENNVEEQNFSNYHLTQREQEVARLLVKGRTYKQISEELFIALPTVKTHASNIYQKCQINNRSELTALLS